MSSVLVTGPDGFVGCAVCAKLIAAGHSVRGALWKATASPVIGESLLVNGGGGSSFVRECVRAEYEPHAANSTPQTESIVVGDIDASTDWCAALKGIDVVVHLAARVHIMDDRAEDPLAAFRDVNVDGTRKLAQEAAKAGVKRFVFISSIKVNGEATGGRLVRQSLGDGGRSEDRGRLVRQSLGDGGRSENPSNQQPSLINRASFSEGDTPAPEDPYGQSKWEAEQVLRDIETQTGLEVVILRPPLLYGPGVKANFLKLIRMVDRGIPLPLGGIRNKRSLLSLTNFADLISVCVTDARAAGRTFTVSDGEDVSSPELVRRIARALGKKPRLIPVPENLLKLAGRLTGKSAQVQRLCSSLQIDSSTVRKILGWKPPVTMEQELNRVAEWYRSR